MPPSFLDELRDFARAFFSLPMEEKQKYSNIRDGQFGKEGYGNDEIIVEGQILDWTDRLYLLVQPEDARKLELWPTYPNSFRYYTIFTVMKFHKSVAWGFFTKPDHSFLL